MKKVEKCVALLIMFAIMVTAINISNVFALDYSKQFEDFVVEFEENLKKYEQNEDGIVSEYEVEYTEDTLSITNTVYDNGKLVTSYERSFDYSNGIISADHATTFYAELILKTLAERNGYDGLETINEIHNGITYGFNYNEDGSCPSDNSYTSYNSYTLEKNGFELDAAPMFETCGTTADGAYNYANFKVDIVSGIKLDDDIYKEVWNKFIDVLLKHPQLDNFDGCTINIEHNSKEMLMNFYCEPYMGYPEYSAISKFSYSNGILTMNSYSNLSDESNFFVEANGKFEKNGTVASMFNANIDIILDVYSELLGYDKEDFGYFLNNNWDNDWTIQNEGIIYNMGWLYSDEEMDKMQEDFMEDIGCESEECNAGVSNERVYKELALDLINGVKSYEEQSNDKFLEGANQKFDIKEGKKLIFRIDIDFNLFDKVYINGKEVDSKYYTVTEGSTVITFNDEYTKTLKNGNYELKVTFNDGSEAETTFTVANTVDNTKTGLYTSIGLIAGLALIGCSTAFATTRKQSKFPQA